MGNLFSSPSPSPSPSPTPSPSPSLFPSPTPSPSPSPSLFSSPSPSPSPSPTPSPSPSPFPSLTPSPSPSPSLFSSPSPSPSPSPTPSPSPSPSPSPPRLPHNYEAILRDANSPINKSSVEKLLEQLRAGITLNQKRKKYWVDKKSNNCFMVYARDLSISWAEDDRNWLWPSLQETSGVVIDAAELINECWLEVHGQFETTKLSPGTLYEVAFVVKLKASAEGWDVPVNVSLTLPDGSKQWHEVKLKEIPREQWIEISVGEFRASPEIPGDMEFSMYEYDSGKWKRGLVIKGVIIRPKN